MAETEQKRFKARYRYALISARKVRLVIDQVRGLMVNNALNRLKHIERRAAPMVAKLIKSAMANAQQEGNVDVDRLKIAEVYCDEGATLKRWRPRAQGRVYPILKRTSHISVVLTEIEENA